MVTEKDIGKVVKVIWEPTGSENHYGKLYKLLSIDDVGICKINWINVDNVHIRYMINSNLFVYYERNIEHIKMKL